MEHTKGPWEMSNYKTGVGKRAKNGSMDLIATLEYTCFKDSRIKDAQLMTAAPDMLEALLFIANNHADELSQGAMELMQEAIDKATK